MTGLNSASDLGSERWGEKTRARIEELTETFDIYGLTEIYGPGISIDCPEHCGCITGTITSFEVVDPFSGLQLPPVRKASWLSPL